MEPCPETESDSARGVSQGTQHQQPVAAAAWQADTDGAASDTAVPTDPEAAEPDSEVSGGSTSLLPPGSYLGGGTCSY